MVRNTDLRKCPCADCEYMRDARKHAQNRGEYFCAHPDQGSIAEYFEAHKILQQPGFIGFGKYCSNAPNRLTRPKWCPLTREAETDDL